MKETWKKLENNLKLNKFEVFNDLAPPASENEIKKIEKQLGVVFPSDFFECLRIHNGQKGAAKWMFNGSEFLSIERIIEEWTIWKNLFDGGDFNELTVRQDSEIKPMWWNPKWIPFTYNGSGDHLCIDLDPSDKGCHGQIISLWHDCDVRKKEANSFALWFNDFVDKSV